VKTTIDCPYTAGGSWHTGVSCESLPPLASTLYITETPDVGGGDLLYPDVYLADKLCSALREQRVRVTHRGAAEVREPSLTQGFLRPHRHGSPTALSRAVGPNTLTLRDNRCTQHHAVWNDDAARRYGERFSVIGDVAPT
jgi:alpha-ketoglutarate-dependent taurine dioxygenase